MAKKPTPAEKHDALYEYVENVKSAVIELIGALYDHMPPDAQRDLNTIKSDLHRASREYTLDTHPGPVA
jgi:hypothetical protein